MVNDVESILNEIKERVRADEESHSRANVLVSDHHAPAVEIKTDLGGNESLARAAAHLTTTARAWDRLPPIVSNRRGAVARIELWVKAQFKSLARWFTWEQVNFNAAVHHALSESVATLTSHQHELLALRRELEQLHELRRSSEAKSKAINASLEKLNAAVERLSVMLSDLAAETRASHSQLANTRLPELVADIDARLAEIRSDLSEEQRVCFKQLSLEASEAAVLEDRGRRALEARLEKLERGKPS